MASRSSGNAPSSSSWRTRCGRSTNQLAMSRVRLCCAAPRPALALTRYDRLLVVSRRRTLRLQRRPPRARTAWECWAHCTPQAEDDRGGWCAPAGVRRRDDALVLGPVARRREAPADPALAAAAARVRRAPRTAARVCWRLQLDAPEPRVRPHHAHARLCKRLRALQRRMWRAGVYKRERLDAWSRRRRASRELCWDARLHLLPTIARDEVRQPVITCC